VLDARQLLTVVHGLEAEGPALVVVDQEGDGVAALSGGVVSEVARVDAVVGLQVGVCEEGGMRDESNNPLGLGPEKRSVKWTV
jgi:hypothetical protein